MLFDGLPAASVNESDRARCACSVIDVVVRVACADRPERGNRGGIELERGGHALRIPDDLRDRCGSIHLRGRQIVRRVGVRVAGL